MRTLVVSSLVLLCACPGPGPSDAGVRDAGPLTDAGPQGSLSWAQWCSQSPSVRCEADVRCGRAATSAGCALQASRTEDEVCQTWAPSFRDGRLFFLSDRAQACLASLTTGCTPVDACAHLASGAVEPAGDCYFDAECPQGFFCGSDTCPGHCTERAAVGETPASVTGCADGLYALFGELPDGGFDFTCQALREEGLPCVTGGCRAGLYCDDASQQCAALKTSGEPCSDNTEAPCAVDLFCQADGRCGPRATTGATCGVCQVDLRCVVDDAGVGRCLTLGATGESCHSRADCQGGRFCDLDGRCAAQREVGATCTGLDDSCQPGLRCEFEGGLDDAGVATPTCVPNDGGLTSGICTPP